MDEIVGQERDCSKRAAEADRLLPALLASLSHDLRTPLAAALGAARTLRTMSHVLNESQKADFLTTIIDESERLNRFIANLLDMTKLESGAVVPNSGLHDLGEVIGSALERASKILAGHRVEVEMCRWSLSIPSYSSRCSSTYLITPRSMLRPVRPCTSEAGETGIQLG
jgi:two-component system sensor histidine kinase KdpD